MDFAVNCILWTLAIYGLIEICKVCFSSYKCRRIESNGIFVIVAVKNQEQQIEGFLRSILFRIFYGKEDVLDNIVVTDLNSVDNTKEILERFCTDNEGLKMVEWDEYKTKLDNLE